MEPSSTSQSPFIPIAIIAGFSIVALAIFFGASNSSSQPPAATQSAAVNEVATIAIPPVNESDFVRGNPNAAVVIVEYSDYECPFCKQYHSVMRQVMSEYGATGRVAWVYRQFPIPTLHPNSLKLSEAALCVGEIGGNDAFWEFSDILFDSRGLQDVINITRLPDFAEQAGISRAEFSRCYESGQMSEQLESQMRVAFDAGVRVTPYTAIMVGTDVEIVEGVLAYDEIKGIIEDVLAQLDGVPPTTPTTTDTLDAQ
jgi:protein-disulfide isomerase